MSDTPPSLPLSRPSSSLIGRLITRPGATIEATLTEIPEGVRLAIARGLRGADDSASAPPSNGAPK